MLKGAARWHPLLLSIFLLSARFIFWPFSRNFIFLRERHVDGRTRRLVDEILNPSSQQIKFDFSLALTLATEDAVFLSTWQLDFFLRCHYPHFARKCCEGFSIVFLAEGERMKIAIRNQATSFSLLLRRGSSPTSPILLRPMRYFRLEKLEIIDFVCWFLFFFCSSVYGYGDMDHLGIRQAVTSKK